MKQLTFRNRIITLGILGCLLSGLASCNKQKSQTASFDMEIAKKEIASRLRAYEDAMSNGDKEVFENLYAEDAEILHNGSPSTLGRKNILKTFESWVRDSVVGGFTTTGLWGDDALLVEEGTGYFANVNETWKSTGKYLLVWKKVDGEWQIFRDTWFSDPKEED